YRPYRSAHPVRSYSPACASAAGTSTIPNARDAPSWPIRTGKGSGCTGAATMAAGCPKASWSSSAVGIPRSRSAASASRSARSRTATEQRLAAAWAKVLGIAKSQIGRRDHFFDLGGTSLSAVKLAIALDRAVSHEDLARHPILADLAMLIDGRAGRRSENRGA